MELMSRFRPLWALITIKAKTLWKLFLKIILEFFKAVCDVVVFVSLLLLMIWLSRKLGKPPDDQDQDLLRSFIEWYAVFYTLALSLIVSQAWRKYNRINSTIDREADALTLLVQTGRLFGNNDLSTQLMITVEGYVNCIRKLRAKDYRTNLVTLQKIRKIRECVGNLITSDKVHDSLKSELIHQYNEVYDARGDRFDLLEQKIPFHIWLIFILFSFAWLWGFFWLIFKYAYLSDYILGCTTLSITYLFHLARDLDDPTSGFWRIKFGSFDSRLL
ncbi:MAG: DUF4239 domain-containing protein [bacterium]